MTGNRTEQFRKTIEQNRHLILSSLGNTPDVCRLLKQKDVLSNEQLRKLQSLPSTLAQKQQLANMLLKRDFHTMKIFIDVLRATDNEDLEFVFDFHRKKILQEFPHEDLENSDSHLSCDCGVPSHTDSDIEDSVDGSMSTDIDVPYIKCGTCSYIKFFLATSVARIDIFKQILDSGEKIDSPCPDCVEKTKGQTLIHAAVLAETSANVLERLELLFEKAYNNMPQDQREGLINVQDALGQTAFHIAVENERSAVVEKLYYHYHCDILIKNNLGETGLDLVNKHLPQVTWSILNIETLAPDKNRDFQDDNELNVDFGRLIGYPLLPDQGYNENGKISRSSGNNNAAENYSEMSTLRKYIENSSGKEDYNLLHHIMVKLFVDLKWQKMRPFLFANMCVKVLLYLWYTLFIVEVFLAECHISESNGGVPENLGGEGSVASAGDKTMWSYLFGGWESAVQALTGFYHKPPSYGADGEEECRFRREWKWQVFAFLVIGILLTIKEVCEALILTKVHHNKLRFLSAYWGSWENRFQIVFNLLLILIGTLAFRTSSPNYYYSYAALSIILVWTLIFIQVGYLMGQGVYVQILGKIIQRFGTLMLNYLCWIIAFSIALSILMPQAKPFETLPKAFLKVMTMMSGELEYEDTFYGESDTKNGNGNDTEKSEGPLPSIVFTAQIVYISVVFLLTIVLSNALIGLAVDDVRELRTRSEVLLRTIKVDKLYIMEITLLKLRTYFSPSLDSIFKRIFLIQPKVIWKVDGDGMPTGNGMVLAVSIKDIPQRLQKEIREYAVYPEAYKYKKECPKTPTSTGLYS